MSSEFEIKVSGLTELDAQLTKAQSRSVPEVTKVVTRGAMNVKQDWRARWSDLSHLPGLARSITDDVYMFPGSVRAEIGADKGIGQGALANVPEYGTRNNAPHPGGLPALQAEEPRFMKALENLGGDLLDG